MLQGRFKDVAKKFQGSFKVASRILKEVFRVFQGRLKGVSRQFQRCSKEVSMVFKESVKWCFKKFKNKKNVSRVFQECFNEGFVLQFCSCMDLIVATRAEGGLVYSLKGRGHIFSGAVQKYGKHAPEAAFHLNFAVVILKMLTIYILCRNKFLKQMHAIFLGSGATFIRRFSCVF